MARRKPVGGKKRRQQLKEARRKQREANERRNRSPRAGSRSRERSKTQNERKDGPEIATSFGGLAGSSKLATLFFKEDREAVEQRRQRGTLPIVPVSGGDPPRADPRLSMIGPGPLACPTRPAWSPSDSKRTVEAREKAYFGSWVRSVLACTQDVDQEKTAPPTGAPALAEMAPFELNLEVWRQLWRGIEFAHVVVIVADVRDPSFHIPPSLAADITQRQQKRLIIALTKCDLVSQEHVDTWRAYLARVYPGVATVPMSSRPPDTDGPASGGRGGVTARKKMLKRRLKQDTIRSHRTNQARSLLSRVWRCVADSKGSDAVQSGRDQGSEGERKVEICLVGHPNVGKTSVLNTIIGQKVASTSRTAGHTKHLQHIPVPGRHPTDPAAAPRGVRAYVIDTPGLVFPRAVPRHHGEVMGLFPIAQIRETMSAVRFIAEKVPLWSAYGLRFPDWCDSDQGWTPQAICEAFAEKKRYFLKRGGAPDVHRAGLEIIRDAVDGALLVAFRPPDEAKSGAAPFAKTTPLPKSPQIKTVFGYAVVVEARPLVATSSGKVGDDDDMIELRLAWGARAFVSETKMQMILC